MGKSLEGAITVLEKHYSTALKSAGDLSSDEYISLVSDVGLIEYTTPWNISYPMVKKYRRVFGSNNWLKFLKGISKGSFWPRITEEQKQFLITGLGAIKEDRKVK